MTVRELTHRQVLDLLPDRRPDSHKGDYGKLLLLCGSRGYTGAAELAAKGALRSGAGLVYLGVPESIYTVEATKLTEPIVLPLPEQDGKLCAGALPEIYRLLPKMDAVLMGPGLGRSEGTLAVVRAVLESFPGPVVLDADGLNVLAKRPEILKNRTAPTVLTPHDGEFARLGGVIGEDRIAAARKLARELGVVVLLKGHRTVITDGDAVYRNTTGNPGMAVGGSGDLLAGILVSLLGQKLPLPEASACAAWLHGAAGDAAASSLGQYALLPTDMLTTLPQFLK